MIRNIVALPIVLLLLMTSSLAQESTSEVRKIRVATKVVPPFVLKTEEGWSGLSFEILDRVAEKLGFEYEVVEGELEQLLAGVSEQRYDAAVAAITVTPEREKRVDFTHPFHSGGFGIVVAPGGSIVVEFISRIASKEFLSGLLALLFVIFCAGALLWYFERKRNPEQFGGGVARGLGSGFWWSAVTMTTVGYGDKAPVSFPGRIVGFIWMFASVITISSFTAAIATTLTIGQLVTGIESPEDLNNERVAVLPNTTGVAFAEEFGARTVMVESIADGFAHVSSGKCAAFVHDHAILVHAEQAGVGDDQTVLLPRTFGRQDYAFALPLGTEERKRWNVALLQILGSEEWHEVAARYTGSR